MRRTATRASPVSYSKRAHTFRTAVGDFPAARARSGSPSFVGFDVNSPVPAGFVAELRTQHAPTRVQDGLRHLGFRELGRADIADDDQGVFADKPRRRLVKLVFARVGDLGVDRANAAFVSCPLRNGKRGLVLAIVAKCRDGRAIAQRGERLKPEIDANAPVAGRQIVRDLALENDEPSPARILGKAPGLDALGKVAGFPEPEPALEISHLRAVDLDGARDKRHPAERALRSEAGPEARTSSLGVTRCGELAADRLHGVRMHPEQRAAAGAEFDQVEGAWPFDDAARFPAGFGLALSGDTEVPNLIGRIAMPGKVFASGCVLDTVFETEHRHSLFPPIQRRSKACNAFGLEAFPVGAPFEPVHPSMGIRGNSRFEFWMISEADAKIGALPNVEDLSRLGHEKIDSGHGRKHVTARQRQRREQEWINAFRRYAPQAGFQRSDMRAQDFALALAVLLCVRRQKLGFRFRDANSDGAFVCHTLYVLQRAVHCKWSASYFAASCGGAPISIIRQYIEQQRSALPPRPERRGFRALRG